MLRDLQPAQHRRQLRQLCRCTQAPDPCWKTAAEAAHSTSRARLHIFTQHRLDAGLGALQGIGLPVEEAMTFWRAEFAPRTPGDKFEKQYAYNIRHNYGKEGNRKSYTPYSCLKVISATPGVVSRPCPARKSTLMPAHGVRHNSCPLDKVQDLKAYDLLLCMQQQTSFMDPGWLANSSLCCSETMQQ